ncbi:hypothetical protein EDB87DRAFT_1343716 [Lactarius vividus]|nr:hypothetical protein EDB87DRAFT_1343716 [Lactarius vividus]
MRASARVAGRLMRMCNAHTDAGVFNVQRSPSGLASRFHSASVCPTCTRRRRRCHGHCLGVLLLAAKDVEASQDDLVDLFRHIENFFTRLESYTMVRPTDAMSDIIVKIMVEVLNVFAIATKEMKQGRAKRSLLERRR